jgi:hypothetical protein
MRDICDQSQERRASDGAGCAAQHPAAAWLRLARAVWIQWGVYFVHMTHYTVRCTCPAWVYRRTQLAGDCKSIVAVQELLAKKGEAIMA